MKIIPAIDLMNGRCVRLVKGEKTQIINYEKSPLEIATDYQKQGINYLHIIDLDGAFTGEMKNLSIIKDLASKYQVQVGGGVRSEEKILELFALGVQKVIVSTLLLKDVELASRLKKKYNGRFLGSFDFKNGKLGYAGWIKQSDLSFEEVVKGLEEIVVTDTSRDGTLQGPNIELLTSIKQNCNCKIIAAGGIRGVQDILELTRIGIDGAIIGRACLEDTKLLRDIIKFEKLGVI
ncbi:1-(5-phosphoribosyl)-5-[(5-phosphoribosylamino)methylideneamino] imidazole-4-carboxamide isomerase [Candidatus Micrarchaeota archaeon]|nr:1-(5-phosphoribosyl)-5-[(5-phosphoribosylamino)methylideneamino] imidazole-4-carboxamide isomerase [Candidatus Micrarchaeota archaeon]MBU1165588.1 1-(5-phosphoribosyl)-5-[(5-phosphoribosylamino)methylideneamino] imidazole-4-carboxamide isomerase [Candidatus Micrarchaeota archaeon]MBU1887399.1 1-(5-phosphoribosyl)-5-[(5-phosphoribosylamino)methylideneamino] imidazole-4-carboxamide isomerase [Candidatus Micrarchaeota archaeon]